MTSAKTKMARLHWDEFVTPATSVVAVFNDVHLARAVVNTVTVP
jgi:hypothetical protein